MTVETALKLRSRSLPHAVPTYEFIVDSASSGIRIDSFLIRKLRNYNPWRIQRIAQAGGVRIQDSLATPTDRVFAGQHVRIRLLEPPDKLLEPVAIDIPVLYEDAWMLVVNKPAGLVAHPVGETQERTLANGLQYLLDQRTGVRGILRPGIVHRLDRQTTGAMAIAITHDAHAALSSAFENSHVSKTYTALVTGDVKFSQGRIDWPIGRARTGRHVLMSCAGDAIGRKSACTRYQVLERFGDVTLVSARPLTGRNHQIRVHFAALGHPLVGDEFYEAGGRFKPFRAPGDDEDTREIETGLPIRRHALHASKLELAHPISGAWMSVSATLPDDFQRTLRFLAERQGR